MNPLPTLEETLEEVSLLPFVADLPFPVSPGMPLVHKSSSQGLLLGHPTKHHLTDEETEASER